MTKVPTGQGFVIRGPLVEVALREHALCLAFQGEVLSFAERIELTSSHLDQHVTIDVAAWDSAVPQLTGWMWHLAGSEFATVEAAADYFEMRFPCGCRLSATQSTTPETILRTFPGRPEVLDRWPADYH